MRQCSNMVYQWGLPADLENKNGLYLDFYHAETYWGGNLRFKIDWASLIVRRKLTVFALF